MIEGTLQIAAVRNAVMLGAVVVIALAAAHSRRAWAILPVLLLAGAGTALVIRALHLDFLAESLRYDPPWASVAALALWLAVGAARAVRLRAWWAVVALTLVAGDLAAAGAVALAEPDAKRRARLVLAASGASLCAPWSGASALAMGFGGWEMAAVGALAAVIAFVPGGEGPSLERPQAGPAWRAALVAVWLGGVVWLAMLGGVSDFAAMGLENLPLVVPVDGAWKIGLVATVAGVLGFEPGVALLGQDILLHATQVRGEWLVSALRVGVALGAGLPMLVATRSSVVAGAPIWAAQVVIGLAWLWWRY